MGDENSDFEPYLYTTTLNFVDSLFNEEDNSNIIKKDNKPSKGPVIPKSKQNKPNELNLQTNNLKENKTNSKTKFNSKKKPLIFRTTSLLNKSLFNILIFNEGKNNQVKCI